MRFRLADKDEPVFGRDCPALQSSLAASGGGDWCGAAPMSTSWSIWTSCFSCLNLGPFFISFFGHLRE